MQKIKVWRFKIIFPKASKLMEWKWYLSSALKVFKAHSLQDNLLLISSNFRYTLFFLSSSNILEGKESWSKITFPCRKRMPTKHSLIRENRSAGLCLGAGFLPSPYSPRISEITWTHLWSICAVVRTPWKASALGKVKAYMQGISLLDEGALLPCLGGGAYVILSNLKAVLKTQETKATKINLVLF